MTSTTTVSVSRPGDFICCCFFRGAAFTARCLALTTLRFVPRLCADFDALRVLPRAAEVLRNFARFFGRALARFFRLAMIELLPAAAYCGSLKTVRAADRSIK
jgi:hypothetical protein